jgi:hypothetical protein
LLKKIKENPGVWLPWLIDFAALFGGEKEVVKELKVKSFQGEKLKLYNWHQMVKGWWWWIKGRGMNDSELNTYPSDSEGAAEGKVQFFVSGTYQNMSAQNSDFKISGENETLFFPWHLLGKGVVFTYVRR